MSTIAAALKHMLAAGMPHDAIVAAVADMEEAASCAPQKSKAALRTERWRAKKASQNVTEASPRDAGENVTAPSQTVTDRHGVTPPRACVGDIKLTSENTCQTDDEDTREPERVLPTDWPEKPIKALVEAVSSPWLDPIKSPGLTTTAGRLAAWKREGASWEHDVVPVVTAVCGKVRKPIGTWAYFDGPIAQTIADNRRALEIPEASHDRPDHRSRPADVRRATVDDSRSAWVDLVAERNGADFAPDGDGRGSGNPDRDRPGRLRLAHAGQA